MGKKVGGILLATGYDEKGRRIDPLAQSGSISAVRRLVMTFQRNDIWPITVVTGFDELSVKRHLAMWSVVFHRGEQMGSATGRNIFPVIQSVAASCDDIVIAAVEYPMFRMDTLRELIAAPGSVRIPMLGRKAGFPVVMEAAALPQLKNLADFQDWESFREVNKKSIVYVPTEDEGVLCSISQPEKCSALRQSHDRQFFHPYTRIDIDCPVKIFDTRARMLLMVLDETGSVRAACDRTAISVGKAWEILNVLEATMGYAFVTRQHGGRHGGRTELTPEGKKFLDKYQLLEQNVKKYADQEFCRIFLNDDDAQEE